jgi:hypothetical protein
VPLPALFAPFVARVAPAALFPFVVEVFFAVVVPVLFPFVAEVFFVVVFPFAGAPFFDVLVAAGCGLRPAWADGGAGRRAQASARMTTGISRMPDGAMEIRGCMELKSKI